jgi:hypothetical protein
MNGEVPEKIAAKVLEQAQALDQVAQILQEAQDELPAPSLKEISALRSGDSFTIVVYLIGLLQRSIVDIENASSDLRATFEEDGLSFLERMRPSAADIAAVETALNERRSRKMSNPLEHPDAEAIACFTKGHGAGQEENRRIVIHLLRGCPECRRKILSQFGPDLAQALTEIEADHV